MTQYNIKLNYNVKLTCYKSNKLKIKSNGMFCITPHHNSNKRDN